MTPRHSACDECLKCSWLLERLAGHLDMVRGRIDESLALSDLELIDAVAGDRRHEVGEEYERFDTRGFRERAAAAGLASVCRCDECYPERLLSLAAPPCLLFVAGDLKRFHELAAGETVAIVGARRASSYGLEVARSLGRGLAAAGLPVISGMAFGIDSAAHAGALDAQCPTIAVLPAGADRPYPAAKRALYRRIRETGAVISELPPSTAPRRWMFTARNRVIAALSAMTVVVEAGERSGALVTAAHATELGRPIGAVPGRVTSPQAVGPHRLLASGATLTRGPQDVLDALFGAGARPAPQRGRPALDDELGRLLGAIGRGDDTVAALTRAGFDAEGGLAGLSELELAGYVRREAGGRYVVVP